MMALLVSLLNPFLNPIAAWRSVRLLSFLMVLVAARNMSLTSFSLIMSALGVLNLMDK